MPRIIPDTEVNPDISWDFYCIGAIRYAYCVALIWAPRHIVKYACVAQTERALYSCPLAPLRYEFLTLNFGIRDKSKQVKQKFPVKPCW